MYWKPCANKLKITIIIPVIIEVVPYWLKLAPFVILATPTNTNPKVETQHPKKLCLYIDLPIRIKKYYLPNINLDNMHVLIIIPPESIWFMLTGIYINATIWRVDPIVSQKLVYAIQYFVIEHFSLKFCKFV